MRRLFAIGLGVLLPLIAVAHGAQAQTATSSANWPTRPVTMIVPFAAGGPVDTIGRIIAQHLSDHLGQNIVIENVGGAGGMIGAARAAKATPDGYTVLLAGSAVLALNQAIYKRPLYNPATDFTPVSMFADSARVLLVRKDLPVKTLKEFFTYAKANQGKMQYGSAGAGSGTHVCAVLMDAVAGTKVAHVPYRGAALAMQDVIAGRLDYLAEQISTAVGQINAGTVKAIAVMGRQRVAVLPKLPTSEEEGCKDLDCGSWAALAFPKGVDAAIVNKLAAATDAVLARPALVKRYDELGVAIPPRERRTPAYLAKFTVEEIAHWGKVIRAAGISRDK